MSAFKQFVRDNRSWIIPAMFFVSVFIVLWVVALCMKVTP